MMTWSAWPDDQRAATEVPRNSGHPPTDRAQPSNTAPPCGTSPRHDQLHDTTPVAPGNAQPHAATSCAHGTHTDATVCTDATYTSGTTPAATTDATDYTAGTASTVTACTDVTTHTTTTTSSAGHVAPGNAPRTSATSHGHAAPHTTARGPSSNAPPLSATSDADTVGDDGRQLAVPEATQPPHRRAPEGTQDMGSKASTHRSMRQVRPATRPDGTVAPPR